MLEYEISLWEKGYRVIAGIDEAGRGPLAGPVVAAAVIFMPEFALKEENRLLKGLTDSKQLTSQQRDYFFRILVQSSGVYIGVGSSSVFEIDRINILQATFLAMKRAVKALSIVPDFILVDGLFTGEFVDNCMAIVGGDSKSLSIAAAGIVAKVVRDAYMQAMDPKFPVYELAIHKGYASRKHIQALMEYGPESIHRRSFRPVKEAEELCKRRNSFKVGAF